jgi:hypothetical protein
MEMQECILGEVVPVTSSLYRVVHDPPKEGKYLQTFYAGDDFPACPECGRNVRYLIPATVLRRKTSN